MPPPVYLKKLRPLYESLGRADDLDALLASIREQLPPPPRFMERLDGVEGRPIVASSRAKRR